MAPEPRTTVEAGAGIFLKRFLKNRQKPKILHIYV